MNKLHFYIVFAMLFLISCKENKSDKRIERNDEISVKKGTFKMPEYKPFIFEFEWYNLTGEERIYKLTNDSLFVFNPESMEKPAFVTNKLPKDSVKKIERLHVYDFKDDYTSPGIRDGIQIRIDFTKQGTTKKINLRNYYHSELSPIIELINELVPIEHKFWYEKKWLLSKTPK